MTLVFEMDMTMRLVAFYLVRTGTNFEYNNSTYKKIRRTWVLDKWMNAINLDTTEYEWFEDSVQVYV